MKQLKIIIERTRNAYSAYAENMEGIAGMGDTVSEAKKSALEAIEIQKALGNFKAGNYQIIYKFDTQSMLNYYKKIFSLAALERITGIDQKYLQHYSTGLKKPRPERRKKIEKSLHNLGAELMALEL
ncbi:MAG: hypothetical protein QM763_01630 [Agriterribacter sp.]